MRLLIVVLIVVIVLALAATIGAIIIGKRSFEGIVVDKPYEAGLSWDEEQRACRRLGWQVSLTNPSFKVGRNDLLILLKDRAGKPLKHAAVTVTVSRPSTRSYDRSYEAAELHEGEGRYRSSVDLVLFGAWDIVLKVSSADGHCSYDKQIFADQTR